MSRITQIKKTAAGPGAMFGLALSALFAVPALAQEDDGVATFGSSGSAAMFGVTTTLNETETEGAPEDIATLISDLEEDTMPEIAWQSVSSVTEVETVTLDSMSGDAEGLDSALSDASGKIGRIRAGIESDSTLRAALEEAGYAPGDVIAAYGSSATEISLVVDTRS
ncbi:hypothetical protein [Citreimonas salinaria]|uniref:Uncharacterized protein n=1 Tax=Citreimonas salinaria TaxID=321339 RepID=A0A1H3HUE9_9RHOB|nr:hypothetical protein [Citreimonas salinaria]SDY19052.1 hypothetical protein SAMN05444340_104171 [Citreimonas salinaria]